MNKEGKSLMFGPPMPLNQKAAADNAKTGTKTDMGAMTDLVRALKEVDASPEKIDQYKHSGVGTATGKNIKSSDNEPHTEKW